MYKVTFKRIEGDGVENSHTLGGNLGPGSLGHQKELAAPMGVQFIPGQEIIIIIIITELEPSLYDKTKNIFLELTSSELLRPGHGSTPQSAQNYLNNNHKNPIL